MSENPKAIAAVRDQKPRLDLLERSMLEEVARAAAAGADKYGIANYRDVEVHARTYAAAAMRHALAFLSGEDIDPDSGCHHMACVGSNVNVFFGAIDAGTMIDDRGPQPRTADQQAMSDANNQLAGVKPSENPTDDHGSWLTSSG